MLKFENSYFEDEVRDGFYIPAMIKRAWAAELEVLAEVDRICRKHNIKYFADWGTLLATVRHEGFIPWDDDLDIAMMREDYERFMEIAPLELPEGFSAYNCRNHDDFWLFLARVVGKQRICFEEEHLNRFHQFPYICGVDIFVLDYVSRDEEAEQARNELAMHTLAIADSFGENSMSPDSQEMGLRRIELETGIKIPRNLTGSDMRRFLYGVVEQLFSKFSAEESDQVTQLFPFGIKDKRFRFPKEYYEQVEYLPYENTMMPVPVQYDEVLKKRYGEYMRLVKNAGGHGYPYYDEQHKSLVEVLDFELPTYKFDKSQLRDNSAKSGEAGNQGGFKNIIRECVEGLEELLDRLEESVKGEDYETAIALLQESQQLAIDMGTLIENIKGEGHATVATLEQYCESIFEFGQNLNVDELEKLYASLEKVAKSTSEQILERKEIVFLPYKASQWRFIESQWKDAIADHKNDVFVVPIPYMYKKYDGSIMDTCYEGDKFSEAVQVVSYESFDLELHHPDVIYIQNPFDEWNPVYTVPEYFYSKNLQQWTDELIYVQSFVVEEFAKNNEREYKNMREYCTMPGVVRADKVIVQSDNMRNRYIQKLIDFAGEDTEEIWDKKILGCGVTFECDSTDDVADAATDESRKKVIVYGHSASCLVEHGEQSLEKIQKAISIFEKNKDKIQLICRPHARLEQFTRRADSRLWKRYLEIVGDYLDDSSTVKELVEEADAYYGDGGYIALEFIVAKKPVMLQDVNIV